MFIHPHGIAVAVEAKNSSPSVNYSTANFKALWKHRAFSF